LGEHLFSRRASQTVLGTHKKYTHRTLKVRRAVQSSLRFSLEFGGM
jgi:hypothetical protein